MNTMIMKVQNQPSNIIVVTDFGYINGGIGQVALSSVAALAEKGYSVTLFVVVQPVLNELKNRNIRVICANQYEIAQDPNRLRAALQGLWNFEAARKISKLLDEYDPSDTIVHIHSWTKALSSSVIRCAIQKKFKVVCTLHDYFSACPNGGFFNYMTNQICTLQPLSFRCIFQNCDLRSYPQKLWRCVRQIIQRVAGLMPTGIHNFITVSGYSEIILKKFLPDNAKIYRIENPVNIQKEEPVRIELNNKFVFCGRISREKGPLLLAKVAEESGCDYVFIGDGDCRNEVIQLYPSAKITGWVDGYEVKNHLKSARALIFPSLWYETYGLVVYEAAALGIPSIVSDISAATDFIEDGVTGLLFETGNESDLLKKIYLLQNVEIAKKMGRAAYEKYWAHPYTLNEHIAKLERCYCEILNR